MRAIFAVACFVCASAMTATSATPAVAGVEVAGTWHGVLPTPIGELTLILTITRDSSGALHGEMESPDQGPGKTPLSTVTEETGRLKFTVAPAQISWEGEWDEDHLQWTGVFRQGGATPLALRRGEPAPRPTVEGLDGLWEGAVVRNGAQRRLILRVATTGRGTLVTLDSPDLGAVGLPVKDFSRRSGAITFSVPATGALFRGTLSADEDRLIGTWTVPGLPDIEVAFVRTRATAERTQRPRPQMPQPPFPYRVEEVTIVNPLADDVTLAGTLTMPDGAGPFVSAVLITGSGPQDRDETVFGHKPFAVLADYLTRRGIVVLRYDDRGAGKSTGDFAAATSADFATDAAAAVRYLRSREAIRRDAIGLIGHSEGAIVAPLAATSAPEVSYLVLLAGPGTKTADLVRAQRRAMGEAQGMSPAELAKIDVVLTAAFAAVSKATSEDDARARLRAVFTPGRLAKAGVPDAVAESMTREMATNWYRYFLRHDPVEVLSRVRVPVLALNGSLDVQVPADPHLAGIEAALRKNRDASVMKLDGLNHLFQTAKTGSMGEYADIEETMSPTALALIGRWIEERFSSAAPR